ncbi:amino acid ABC transporter membrane protein 1 (PAAT family) [Stella humosa]|uniref:Amino acid ABC transporter membrane protein 1 (PAAT family) n=1 Tax=Stella humosa TaxID=94 RepID=A0A3N1M5E2_9PROT|nr:amino acid ABC transporter permease [Stella humosa]ROQ01012.1 amino acid ABC transporter membrane protein 1 (PAAT family) [Stella humosa]BBK31380.1 amino acid ABC transporter permease [Stella humosa]
MTYQFNFDPIFRSFDKMLAGLWLGLWLAALSLAIGCVIGLLVAYGRQSRIAPLRWALVIYVEVIRNCPILLLIFFVYFGLPELGIFFLDKIDSFVLTLSIYAGAYLSEVFRSGLSSIPVRYVEAAKAIGLRPWQRQRYVVLPVMFRITLPALANNLISLFKDTSLAAAIAIPELTFITRQINANTFRVMESWLTASVLYLVTCYAIAWALRRVERRYAVIR